MYWAFKENILSADLADRQLISKFNNRFRCLDVIDIFSKYAWVISLKHYFIAKIK